jgi:hypothetical protein
MLSPSSAAVLAPAGNSHPQGVDTDIRQDSILLPNLCDQRDKKALGNESLTSSGADVNLRKTAADDWFLIRDSRCASNLE